MYWRWKQNFRKPGVFFGARLALWRMNRGHRLLQSYALQYVALPFQGTILDIGCGGGAFIARMHKIIPEAKLYGVDYSPVSVRQSQVFNRKAIATGHVSIVEGSVDKLPFENATFDFVTACETIYFWPNLAKNFSEIARVLKTDGRFLVLCDTVNKTAAEIIVSHIEGMRVYTQAELITFFEGAGFAKIETRLDAKTGRFCIWGTRI